MGDKRKSPTARGMRWGRVPRGDHRGDEVRHRYLINALISIRLHSGLIIFMTKTYRPATTATFEHTITGLLSKRRDMLTEAELLRDRLAEIKNDLLALDRTLGTLGYKGDLEAMMPRQKRQVVFGRGDLIRAILDELRGAERPLRSREIAQAIIAVQGNDPRDQRYIADLTRRVGKALRPLRAAGSIQSATDEHGSVVWRIA